MPVFHARVIRLEERLRPSTCTRCYDHPYRVVVMDEHEQVLSESLPDSGCPECGRPILRELLIIGDESIDAAGVV